MVEAEAANDAIKLAMRRHRNGIKIAIKAQPEVEAFFEQWSGGAKERPAHGRLWRPVGEPQLVLWALGTQNLGPSASRPYSLIHSGTGFYTEHGYPNISFLRLVGVSRPDGVELVVEAVLGRGEIAGLMQRTIDACGLFYGEYLQDINMQATVSVLNLPVAA